jgi:hypothetical protein
LYKLIIKIVKSPTKGAEKFKYLVAAADHLFHTKSESKESMFTGLTILGKTSLKTISSGVNDKNSTISLGSPSNHILNEIPVSGGINDSEVVLSCLKLP